MNIKYLVLIAACIMINNIIIKAQVTIYPFLGVYECKRYNNGGSYAIAYLHVTPLSYSDTIFRMRDPDVYGGSWEMSSTLHQDSTFDLDYYNCYGRFYGSDSIYLNYYHHYPYGDEYYEYYGRNLNVSIADNPKFPEPIEFIYNPAFNNIQIINNLNTCEIQCELFSVGGSKLVSQSIYSNTGETNSLFTGHLPGGVYILRLSGGGYVRTGKILIEN